LIRDRHRRAASPGRSHRQDKLVHESAALLCGDSTG
jgi:hypothetical protein